MEVVANNPCFWLALRCFINMFIATFITQPSFHFLHSTGYLHMVATEYFLRDLLAYLLLHKICITVRLIPCLYTILKQYKLIYNNFQSVSNTSTIDRASTMPTRPCPYEVYLPFGPVVIYTSLPNCMPQLLGNYY